MGENKRTFHKYDGIRIDIDIDTSDSGDNGYFRNIKARVSPWRNTFVAEKNTEFAMKIDKLTEDGLKNPNDFGLKFLFACAKEETDKQAEIEGKIQELLLQWGQHEVNRAVYTRAALGLVERRNTKTLTIAGQERAVDIALIKALVNELPGYSEEEKKDIVNCIVFIVPGEYDEEFVNLMCGLSPEEYYFRAVRDYLRDSHSVKELNDCEDLTVICDYCP